MQHGTVSQWGRVQLVAAHEALWGNLSGSHLINDTCITESGELTAFGNSLVIAFSRVGPDGNTT